MQRGSDKHSPAQDDRLKAELNGMLGSAGGHREEWADPEPPADDDGPVPGRAADPEIAEAAAGDPGDPAADAESDERLQRMQHDLGVANNDRPPQV